jgi:hypothetical protein
MCVGKKPELLAAGGLYPQYPVYINIYIYFLLITTCSCLLGHVERCYLWFRWFIQQTQTKKKHLAYYFLLRWFPIANSLLYSDWSHLFYFHLVRFERNVEMKFWTLSIWEVIPFKFPRVPNEPANKTIASLQLGSLTFDSFGCFPAS